MGKTHKEQPKHIKVKSDFLREILYLLAEAHDYLDHENAWERSEEIYNDVEKVLDKASDLGYPVRAY